MVMVVGAIETGWCQIVHSAGKWISGNTMDVSRMLKSNTRFQLRKVLRQNNSQ
jgi:hypothetical protein